MRNRGRRQPRHRWREKDDCSKEVLLAVYLSYRNVRQEVRSVYCRGQSACIPAPNFLTRYFFSGTLVSTVLSLPTLDLPTLDIGRPATARSRFSLISSQQRHRRDLVHEAWTHYNGVDRRTLDDYLNDDWVGWFEKFSEYNPKPNAVGGLSAIYNQNSTQSTD